MRSLSCLVCLILFVWAARFASASEKDVYDVVPRGWITAGGENLPVVPAHQQDGRAYVFPSLRGHHTAKETSFTTPNTFFLPKNRYPKKGQTYKWPSSKAPCIQIAVARAGTGQDQACFEVDAESMTHLRRLDWERVRSVQREFRAWLLSQSGCPIFADRINRFANFDRVLEVLWREHILAAAIFPKFAKSYLKPVEEFEFTYTTPTPGSFGSATMKAFRLVAREQLSISWGSIEAYPFNGMPPGGVLGGYSRLGVGGESQLQICPNGVGLSLALPGEHRLSAMSMDDDKNVDLKKAVFPFPRVWAGMMGDPAVFIPIFNGMDLQNRQVLAYTGSSKRASKTPPYLYLLAPLDYVKADSGTMVKTNEFAIDAATGFKINEFAPLQLTRRYLVVGTQAPGEEAVKKELGRLLEAAASRSPKAKRPGEVGEKDFTPPGALEDSELNGYSIGVFAHQSTVKAGYNVTLNGQPKSSPVSHNETWGGLVASWKVSVLAADSTPRCPPVLETIRTNSSSLGKPGEVMVFRFYTTAPDVLNAARVAEGDELTVSR